MRFLPVPTQAYCDFLAEDARDTRTDVSVRVFEDKFLTEEVQIKRMVVKFKGSFANDTRSFDSDVPVYRLAEAYLLKWKMPWEIRMPLCRI